MAGKNRAQREASATGVSTRIKSQPVTIYYTLDGILTQRPIPDALTLGGP